MTQQSVALATTLVFTCKRGHQSKVAPDPCPSYFEQTSTASSNRVREKASWYKSNVAFVLGLLASGCGGTKSSIIGSFLGLPGSQYFGQNHFAAIEDEVGPFLRQVAEHSMDEALKMEVKKTVSNHYYYKWLKNNIPTTKYPKLAASYDMGWQKRSSGKTYNSPSGHGMMIGCQTSKIIDAIILSKKCNICSTSTNNPPPPHTCPKNYDGSSKGMEAEGSLCLCIRAFERRYQIGIIVSDDNSTMRAVLKHSHREKEKKD